MTAGLLFVPLASVLGETCHKGLWEAGDEPVRCSFPRIAVRTSAFAAVCHSFILFYFIFVSVSSVKQNIGLDRLLFALHWPLGSSSISSRKTQSVFPFTTAYL
jgi:hypothetical protein